MALPLSRCLGVCNFKHVKSILLQYCYHALIQKSNSDIDVLCATVTKQSFKSLRSTVNSLLATIRAMQAQIDILNSKYCYNVIYHLYVQTKLDCIYIYIHACVCSYCIMGISFHTRLCLACSHPIPTHY